MYTYDHTQPGTFFRMWPGMPAVGFGIAAVRMLFSGNNDPAAIFAIAATFCMIIVALFHSLTVKVSSNEIVLAFGIGLIRKHFRTHDIQKVDIVRNRWYHGWGIKRVRGSWLYNVSGFDAVEIQFSSGRRIRIGTDEPKALLAAIQSAADTTC